jgi:hypothetical protein
MRLIQWQCAPALSPFEAEREWTRTVAVPFALWLGKTSQGEAEPFIVGG